MLKLLVYGAGKRGKFLIDHVKNLYDIVWIDKNESKWETVYNGVRIQSPSAIKNVDTNEKFVITLANECDRSDIRHMLCEDYGFLEDNEEHYLDILKNGVTERFFKEAVIPECMTMCGERTTVFSYLYSNGFGGIEVWSRLICKEFLLHNQQAFVLTNADDFNFLGEIANNRLLIEYEHQNPYEISKVNKLVDFVCNHLPCTLVTSQPDEILVSCAFLKQLFGDKLTVIAGIRGGSESIYDDYYALRDCVDHFVCVSSDISSAMISRGVPEGNVHTMICPVTHPDKFDRSYPDGKDIPIRLGFAGRIEIEQKRMDLMKKLICLLEKSRVNYSFDIAGDGSYKNEMELFVKEMGIADRVHFPGLLSQKEISAFWTNHDVCVNIADLEGRSRMIAEAMAHGAVPVVTRVSGTNDDIHEGENGFTVDIGDYEALADKIKYLDDNRELLPIMGEKAYKELEPKCDYEKHYQWWENLLDEIWNKDE